MEAKAVAEEIIDLIKGKKEKEIIPFMKKTFEEKELIKKLIQVQIQMKEIGGGWPPIGEQITTLEEIEIYTKQAVEVAKEKGEERSAGVLYHNLASFCLPNMDDGVDEKYSLIAYESAVKDLEIREKLDKKGEMLWARWLVGVSEFVKGEIEKSLDTLELTIKQAEEEPRDESIIAWSKMMIAKFYFKAIPEKRDLAIELIEEVKQAFAEQEDKYGSSILEAIIKEYF